MPGIESWIGLSLVPGVGGEYFRRLLSAFGNPERALSASQADLATVVPHRVAQVIAGSDWQILARDTLSWLSQPPNQALTWVDSDYPPLLKEIPDPPPLLYLKGRRQLLNARALAIVGSRNPTPQGIKNAEQFAQRLSDAGLTIVSGLASGIDAAAHRGGLAGASSSIAVAGTGLDLVYPANNRDLARRLGAEGALVSELPLGTTAVAGNFPRRNRLISAFALGCLIVEAAPQSGSLITARLALEQGREVFAIPGSIHSPQAKGCHALIKQGAKLVETVDDILCELSGQAPAQAESAQSNKTPELGLLSHLGYDPCPLDMLCARSGLSADRVIAELLQLELEGRVCALPGGLYQRLG